jgi:hypothetical protein
MEGNVTGFISWEFNFSKKSLELLKQVAPDVTRVTVLRDTAIATGTSQFAEIQALQNRTAPIERSHLAAGLRARYSRPRRLYPQKG